MKIEWWMLDGGIILIVLISALLGMKRGLGATLIRLIGLVGGLVLAVLFKDDVSKFLMGTPLKVKMYRQIFELLRPDNDYSESLPGFIGKAADEAADKAAGLLAERITNSLIGILSFLVIVLAFWIVSLVLRAVLRTGRRRSVVIGGADALLGLALGLARGFILACLAVAALLPLTTLLSPQSLPAVIKALHASVLTKIIYEVNPLLAALKSIQLL